MERLKAYLEENDAGNIAGDVGAAVCIQKISISILISNSNTKKIPRYFCFT